MYQALIDAGEDLLQRARRLLDEANKLSSVHEALTDQATDLVRQANVLIAKAREMEID
jgi:hypothetical protein